MLKKEFSLDPATSLANRAQVASYTVAWQSAQARAKQQAEVEATSETREWAKPIPVSDYIAVRQRFAREPEDKHIPAKEYIEKKLAELEAGEFRAETLGEILSRDEVDPDVLVPHWDANGHQLRSPAHRARAAAAAANSDVQRARYDQAKTPWPQRAGRYQRGLVREIQGLSPWRFMCVGYGPRSPLDP